MKIKLVSHKSMVSFLLASSQFIYSFISVKNLFIIKPPLILSLKNSPVCFKILPSDNKSMIHIASSGAVDKVNTFINKIKQRWFL